MSLSTIFQIIFEPIFKNSESSPVNIAVGVFTVVSNITILVTGFLLRDLSAKHFVVIGSSLIFVGLILSSFVRTFSVLLLTFSILIGIGTGLLNPATFVAVLSCFSISRNHAVGFCFAALGFGQFLMPIIANLLLESCGFRATIALIGI